MAKETIEKILRDLEMVKKVIQCANETGKFPDIEKDIALSKLRNIYEFIHFIQPTIVAETPEKAKIVISGPEKENTKKIIESIENTSVEVLNSLENLIPEAENLNLIKEIKQDSTQKHIKEEILAEKLKEPGQFINEVLMRYVDTFDLSKKLQNQPISDISTAIGLNDRFLFIKELFNNDSDLYKQTIDTLNKASNFNNAIQYIDSNFKWDFDNPSVQKLLELIRRRHPISEG